MKKILFATIFSTLFVGCQHQQPVYQAKVIMPAPALREVFRGGEIQGLEKNDGQFLGTPNQYDLVEHVCKSFPIFDINGRYVRTAVRCW